MKAARARLRILEVPIPYRRPRRQFEGGWLIPRHSPGREPYRRNVLPSCSVGELISAHGIHAGYLCCNADTTKLPVGRLVHLGLTAAPPTGRRWAPHTSAYEMRRPPLTDVPPAAEYRRDAWRQLAL